MWSRARIRMLGKLLILQQAFGVFAGDGEEHVRIGFGVKFTVDKHWVQLTFLVPAALTYQSLTW